jgi:Flp pilus assembly protein TadB
MPHALVVALIVLGSLGLLLAINAAIFAAVRSAQTTRRLEALDAEREAQAAQKAEQEKLFRHNMLRDVHRLEERGLLANDHRDAFREPRVRPKQTDTAPLRTGLAETAERLTGRGCRGGM